MTKERTTAPKHITAYSPLTSRQPASLLGSNANVRSNVVTTLAPWYPSQLHQASHPNWTSPHSCRWAPISQPPNGLCAPNSANNQWIFRCACHSPLWVHLNHLLFIWWIIKLIHLDGDTFCFFLIFLMPRDYPIIYWKCCSLWTSDFHTSWTHFGTFCYLSLLCHWAFLFFRLAMFCPFPIICCL